MKIKNLISYFKVFNILQKASDAWQKNELTLAKELYGDVLKIDSSNFKASLWLGVLLFHSNKNDEAMVYLEKACFLNIKDYRPNLFLGRILAKKRKYDDAISKYESVLKKINPGKVSNTDEYFNTILEVYYYMALIYFYKTEYGSAIDYANKVLKIDSKYNAAEELKMSAYQCLKNNEELQHD